MNLSLKIKISKNKCNIMGKKWSNLEMKMKYWIMAMVNCKKTMLLYSRGCKK